MRTDDLSARFASLLQVPESVDALRNELREVRAELREMRRQLPSPWVSIAEFARRAGVSEPTVRRQIKAGRLRKRSIGSRVLVDASVLSEAPDADPIGGVVIPIRPDATRPRRRPS